MAEPAGDEPPIDLVPGRSCDGCQLCCILPDIEALDKPANMPCRHCSAEGGCAAYLQRPQTCRDFFCLWRTDAGLGAHWNPVTSGMMIYRQGPQLTVLVQPGRGGSWHGGKCGADLSTLAGQMKAQGGYVVVFEGDAVTVVEV